MGQRLHFLVFYCYLEKTVVALKQRNMLVHVTSKRNQNLKVIIAKYQIVYSNTVERSFENRPKEYVDLFVDDVDGEDAKPIMVDY